MHYDWLQRFKKYDQGTKSLVPWTSSSGEGGPPKAPAKTSVCINVLDQNDDTNHPFIRGLLLTSGRPLEGSKETFNVLLDTGALDGDYISPRVASSCIIHTCKEVESNTPTTICSACNHCVTINNKYEVSLQLSSPSDNSVTIDMNTTVSVVPIGRADIIIGRPTMRKYHLFDVFRAHLASVDTHSRGGQSVAHALKRRLLA